MQGGSGADDDKEHDDHATDAAEEDVQPGLRILARANFLFDEAGLQIEKLPRRDGGADQRGESDQITGIPMDAGNDGHASGENPIGFREDCGKQIGEIERAGDQEDDFDLAGSSLQHQNPDGDGGERHGDEFADAEELRGGGDTGEFGDDVAEVDEESGDHDEKGGAEAELFADQIGEAFAGDHAHARAHFHGDVEGDGHGDQGPEQGVAVGAAGLRCRWRCRRRRCPRWR